jgi:hypothetical protein
MKSKLYLLLPLIVLFSCKKELGLYENTTNSIQKLVIDSLGSRSTLIDFKKAWVYKVDSSEMLVYRFPLKGKNIRNDFILLQIDKTNQIFQGRIIHLEGHSGNTAVSDKNIVRFNGNITIQNLKGENLIQSRITEGYVEAFHKMKEAHVELIVPKEDVLPEIIVISSPRTSDITSYMEWISIQSFLYLDGGGYSPYYGSMSPSSDGISLNNYNSYVQQNYSVFQEPVLKVDYELFADKPAIDVSKFLKCFEMISDIGSSCSIEIFSDIPVDTDPNKLLDWREGAPGHVFLQLRKSNANKTLIQNIGFYPINGYKVSLTDAPIAAKFVDDGEHEFNASLLMPVSSADFKSVITEILYAATAAQYDIDQYNCTDFALDIFNKTRVKKLIIPKYHLPGSLVSGSNTPNGLFNQLKLMKLNGDPEANNISMGFSKAWAPLSNGPCY